MLEERGYDHGFEHVHGLLQQADLVVANLETPLTTLRTSPFEDIRTWLHYGDPELTPKHLLAHDIRAVTLANNHTHDYGVEGLLDTFAALEAHGIMAVGAGRDLDDARQPLRIEAELAIPTRRRRPKRFGLSLFSAFRGGRQFREELKAYADTDRPGSASLALNALSGRIRQIREQRPEELIVVMPHWRRDYKWRSNAQAEAAERLTGAGADLVIGHGSHMLQEIELVNGRWVVNGIGNFLFNSPGRYQSLGAPPYSLIARLTITHAEGTLRLYPIVTDNRRTGYQPRPVNDTEFAEVHTLLADKTNAPDHFRREFEPAEDEHGWHLAIQLDRDTSRKSGRSSRHRSADAPPIRVATDPTSADPLGFDRRRDTSTQLIAHELEQRDIQVQWLTRNFIVAEANGVRLGYLATDSHATGAASVRAARRKDLTRHLLADAGLAIARGDVFDHQGGQAEAASLAQPSTRCGARPGSAPLQVSSLARRIQRAKERRPDEFIVVIPHWRRDYQWRSDRQADSAARLVEAGADLVLGHGSHMMQEIEKLSGRWVVHGIGNFVFNSRGRYGKLDAPPHSLIARLTARAGTVRLTLYPIVTDNRRVMYQPRPVTEDEFSQVAELLTTRSNLPEAFQEDFRQGKDEYGHCLTAELR